MSNNLLPLKTRLKKIQSASKMSWETIEKDYLLAWILYAIAQEPSLNIIFKGGTALKKCYFGEYRFSEDLDFTALSSKSSDRLIDNVSARLREQLNEIEQFEVQTEKYLEKEPHPEGQEAYIFKCKFSWHRASHVKIYVEISQNEVLCYPSLQKTILHDYGENFKAKIPVYSLSEIVTEKLRSILQHTKKIHERQWTRSRARDYYDLWRIFTSYSGKLDNYKGLNESLLKKCSLKEVSFSGAESFFDELMMRSVRQTWDRWLSPLVPTLPECDRVLANLKPLISQIVNP